MIRSMECDYVGRVVRSVIGAFAIVMLVVACGGGETDDAVSDSTEAPTGTEAPATTNSEDGADQEAEVERARGVVEAELEPVTWEDPGPALEVGDQLEGLEVTFVGNLGFEFDQNLLAGVRNAAEILGMSVEALDAEGENLKAGQLIEQAAAQGTDVIINKGFPEEAIEEPLRAVDVPVIGIGPGVPQLPPAEIQELGVPAWAVYCYPCAGRVMADWIIADSGADATVAVFGAPELSVTPAFQEAVVDQLQENCSACEVSVVEAPLARWAENLPALTAAQINSNPDLNYIVALYDPMTAHMVPAIESAGAEDRVKIVARGAALAAMQEMESGSGILAANYGNPQQWLGWALMDQVVRVMTDNEPLEDERIPGRLFVKGENLDEIEVSEEDSYYGDVDFAGNYMALWGFEDE